MAVLEFDLRALSAEARRRYPAVKDGAEHAILKVTLRCLCFRFALVILNYIWFELFVTSETLLHCDSILQIGRLCCAVVFRCFRS